MAKYSESQVKIGLQLYSIRDEIERRGEFDSILRDVRDMGFEGVEFAGFGKHEAAEMKAILDKYGLQAAGSHVGMPKLTDAFAETLTYLKIIGCPRVTLAWYEVMDEKSALDTAMQLHQVGGNFYEKGIGLSYHNHAHEYKPTEDGRYPMDILLKAAPELKFEPDCYWIANAGLDPVAEVSKYVGRLALVHLKDIAPDGKDEVTGDGSLDIEGIVAAASKQGPLWYISERDTSGERCMESAAKSAQNLRRLLR